MLLKYIDLHNKLIRDAENPLDAAEKILAKGYHIVGVAVHNEGKELKKGERYHELFENYFERLAKKGLIILPFIELKVREEGEDLHLCGYMKL